MPTISLEKASSWAYDFLLGTYPKFVHRLCRRPLVTSVCVTCFIVQLCVMSTLAFGGFKTGAEVNLLQDRGFIPSVFFAFAAFYYYLKMPAHFSSTFARLWKNGVFPSDNLQIGQRANKLASDPRVRALPVIIASVTGLVLITMGLLRALRKPDILHWFDINILSGAIVVFNWMLIWFALSGLVTSMAIAAISLKSIFASNGIQVHSLHPDKAGGLSPIGDFSLQLTVMAILPGLLISFSAWQSIDQQTFNRDLPMLLLYAILCFGILPMLFYLPIRSAHRAMLSYRHNLIRETYSQYSAEHLSLYDSKKAGTSTNARDAVEQMDILQRLARHESSYPVWPFAYRTRVRVFLNSSFPLTCTLVGVFVDKMLG